MADPRTQRLAAAARAAVAHVVAMGPCDDADEYDEDEPYCGSPACTYCALAEALDALEHGDEREDAQEGEVAHG